MNGVRGDCFLATDEPLGRQKRLRRHFSLILNPKVRLTVVELVETETVTKIAISALSSDGDLYFF
jgi:hypothetical protein